MAEIDRDTIARLQEYADLLRDQARQLRNESALRRDIYNDVNRTYDVAKQIYFIDQKDLGTKKVTERLKRRQLDSEKALKNLKLTQLSLDTKQGRVYREMSDNLGDIIELQKQFENHLSSQVEVSEKIQNNIGVGLVSSMRELTSKYLGSTFSKPFEDAAEAARNTVRQKVLANREAREELTMIEEMKKGSKGMYSFQEAARKSFKHYVIQSKKTGNNLYGTSRAAALYTGQGQNVNIKRNKLPSGAGGTGKALVNATSSLLKGVSASLVVFTSIGTVLKTIVELFGSAQKQNVDIARTLSRTRNQSEAIRLSFGKFAADSEKSYINIERMVEAQKAYTDVVKLGIKANEETLGVQNQLVHRLGLGETEAAKIGVRFDAINKNADKSIDVILKNVHALRQIEGIPVQLTNLFKEIAEAGGQVTSFYRGSNVELAKAVMLTSKYGINLSQAKQISGNLLDFESSLRSELTAELITGKQYNMELARQYALQGQIAKASKEVLKQVGSYEEYANLNVIAQDALAKAVGMTSDELADSLLKQKHLTREMNAFLSSKRRMWSAEANAAAERYAMEGLTQEEIYKTVTASESFREAMDKVKSQFSTLVNSGVLYDLTDLLRSAIDWMIRQGFGSDARAKRAKELSDSTQIEEAINKGKISRAEVNKLAGEAAYQSNLLERMFGWMSPYAQTGVSPVEMKNVSARAAMRTLEQLAKESKTGNQSNVVEAEDFTIKTHPKDTLVAAGGTNLAQTDKMVKYLSDVVKEVRSLRDEVVKGNKKPVTFYEA